nr:hypothetical protein [Angustibacter aerolatus]
MVCGQVQQPLGPERGRRLPQGQVGRVEGDDEQPGSSAAPAQRGAAGGVRPEQQQAAAGPGVGGTQAVQRGAGGGGQPVEPGRAATGRRSAR